MELASLNDDLPLSPLAVNIHENAESRDAPAPVIDTPQKVQDPKTDETFTVFSELETKTPTVNLDLRRGLSISSFFNPKPSTSLDTPIKPGPELEEVGRNIEMKPDTSIDAPMKPVTQQKEKDSVVLCSTTNEPSLKMSLALWDSNRLKSELVALGLESSLAEKFVEHDISGSLVAKKKYFRKPSQLLNLGITKYGHQIKVLEVLKKIRRQHLPKSINPKKIMKKTQRRKKKIVVKNESVQQIESISIEREPCAIAPSVVPPEPYSKFQDSDELSIISEIKLLMSKSAPGRAKTPSPEPCQLPQRTTRSPTQITKRVVLFQSPSYDKKTLVNADRAKEEEKDAFIADFLGEKLYPHQLDGIRFMWKNVVQEDAGCVLAHSMGLGKTIQVVSFVYTLIQQRLIGNTDIPKEVGKRILIVCPPIVISNWKNEFHKWIPSAYINSVRIFLASNYSSLLSKIQMLEVWNSEGGVLIIGYQMLRELLKLIEEETEEEKEEASKENDDDSVVIVKGKTFKADEVNKKLLLRLKHLLLDEGPDLIIADEGHHIKNLNSQLSHQVSRFKTKHRVCLTGYPLQNNLIEYYCMIDFVRPDFLVNTCRYRSRYVTPIAAGSFKDSTLVQKMSAAQRLFILGKIIEPIVHRLDNGILRRCLPPKYEFKIQVKMSPLQAELYDEYLEYLKDNPNARNPTMKDFMDSVFVKTLVLTRLLNHPACLWSWHKAGHSTAKYNDRDQLVSGGFYSVPLPSIPVKKSKRKPDDLVMVDQMSGLASFPEYPDEDEEEEWRAINLNWAEELYAENNVNLVRHSHKMQIILSILRECKKVRERVLIFSRSIPTLDFIQDVFEDHDITYYRIDGSVPQIRRTVMIDEFANSPNAPDAFLISTMAGSLGINLTRASRVILVDLGWNPCHDEQAIARVFRFSQVRPTFVYRLQTFGTIESKLYNLNVYKQAMSLRVLDHRNIEKHFRKDQLASFFKPPEMPPDEREITADLSKDPILRKLIQNHPEIVGASCHISFLEKESDDTIDSEAYIEAEAEVYKEQRRLEHYHRYGPDSQLPPSLMDSLEHTYIYNKKVEETKNASRVEKDAVLRAYQEQQNENNRGYQILRDIR